MPIERRTGVCTVANAGVIRKPSVLPSLPSRNRVAGSEKRDSERIVGNPDVNARYGSLPSGP